MVPCEETMFKVAREGKPILSAAAKRRYCLASANNPDGMGVLQRRWGLQDLQQYILDDYHVESLSQLRMLNQLSRRPRRLPYRRY